MISVLTLTYKRYQLLEEAIHSFLLQNVGDCEMVIINDNTGVDYILKHPNIKIINHKERFSSIGKKIEFGYKQCKYKYIYRLDDDDLLSPKALYNLNLDIKNNPGYEIYRSSGVYFFVNNEFKGESSSVNNGNLYTKDYLDRINIPDSSFGEDVKITFHNNAKIYESKLKHTMIYRWGMGTFHISGLGNQENKVLFDKADEVLKEEPGVIYLNPKFNDDYWSFIL
jgi:glycosyltransferase involved in cell wall biosynthesis